MKACHIDILKSIVSQYNLLKQIYYNSIYIYNLYIIKDKQNQQNHKNNSIPNQSNSNYQKNSHLIIITSLIISCKFHDSILPFSLKDFLQQYIKKFTLSEQDKSSQLLEQSHHHLTIQQKQINSLQIQFIINRKINLSTCSWYNYMIEMMGEWDQWSKYITYKCIDIRFKDNKNIKNVQVDYQEDEGKEQNLKMKIKQQQNKNKAQYNYNFLLNNLDKLLHKPQFYYFHYNNIHKQKQPQSSFYSTLALSLSILYTAIIQLSQNIFTKKYQNNLITKQSKSHSINTINSIDYIFNDFLMEKYGIKIKDISKEICFVKEMMKVKQIEQKQIDNIRQKQKELKYFVRKEKVKIKNNISKSKLMNNFQYLRTYQKNSQNHNKSLISTFCQSNYSKKSNQKQTSFNNFKSIINNHKKSMKKSNLTSKNSKILSLNKQVMRTSFIQKQNNPTLSQIKIKQFRISE